MTVAEHMTIINDSHYSKEERAKSLLEILKDEYYYSNKFCEFHHWHTDTGNYVTACAISDLSDSCTPHIAIAVCSNKDKCIEAVGMCIAFERAYYGEILNEDRWLLD